MRFIINIVCFLFLLPLIATAQTYKYIGVENGLSNRRIFDIQKDSVGYMWFLTNEGIDRYNGKDIKHYKLIEENKELKCPGCNSTFDEIASKGKFQCPKCYETFESQIDEIIKKIQGSNTHVGRLGMSKPLEVTKQVKHNNKISNKLEELKLQLKQAIKEERYEDAAKIRDEIKKFNKEN